MEIFWEKDDWEVADKHLAALKVAPFKRPFPALQISPGSLYLIRGPRQIGKSSWLKTILAQQLAKKRKCFFLSCENVGSQQELAEIMKSIRSRDVIFLDEVTYVNGWALAVKHELDRGSANAIIATGSNSIDLLRGGEQLPGRFGEGGEYELLPMEFPEFHAMRRFADWPNLEHEAELELFFRVGGFPAALIEAGPSGKLPVKMTKTLHKWISGDIVRYGKDAQYLNEIVGQIALTTGSTISLQTLAQKTQIGSHHTAKDYVNMLEAMFAVRTIYNVDQDTGAFRFRSDKKFYFRDPLLYWMALDMAQLNAPQHSISALAELCSAEFLGRRFPRMGFLKTSAGEVDFFIPGRFALEVKWSPAATNLSKAYLKIISPQKIVWSKSNYMKEVPN